MSSSVEQIVQQSVEAYNNRDIEPFMALFSSDVTFHNFPDPAVTMQGLDTVRKFYTHLFHQSPKLHSTILRRIVFGNKVIDHERIVGRFGSPDALELVLIYEVENGKISRATVIRN